MRDMQQLVDLRYGINQPNYVQLIRSYQQIAKLTKLGTTTVFYVLKRFVARGYRLAMVRMQGNRRGVMITNTMREFLFDFRALQNFGLQRRCEMFRARFGARLGKTRLAKLYRAEGCSYSLPKRKYTREY